MHNRFTAAAIGCLFALGLAGCNTPGVTPIVPTITLPDSITSATTKVCGYVPDASTIAGILATYSGNGVAIGVTGLVSTIAQSICTAVAPAKGHRFGARLPVVRGVVVRGRFQ